MINIFLRIAPLSLFLFCIANTQADEPISVEPGSSLGKIQQAIEEAHEQGGGVVLLKAGEYTLDRALELSNKQNVTLLGEKGTVLKAAAEQITQLAESASADATRLVLDQALNVSEGMQLEIHSPGRKSVSPSGKKQTAPYVMVRVERVEGKVLHLARPVKYAVPRGAEIIVVFNGIVLHGNTSNVTIQNITLDMNRDAWPIEPLNHTFHCAIIGRGPYSYEKGPSGPPVEGVRITGCTIKNAHQRGIAFYSVIHSGVYDCRIENTAAEGIDFDHFTYHCEAVGNTLVDCHNIELNDASDCLVAHNRIVRPAVGVVVWQWCQLPGLNERNLILNNEIIDSKGEGVSLRKGAERNVVRGNLVRDSSRIGILVEGDHNVITGNTVSGSKVEAVKIAGKGNVFLP